MSSSNPSVPAAEHAHAARQVEKEARVAHETHVGWTATVAASWTLAGGVAGGVLVSVFVLASRIHPEAVVPLALLMASLGAILGTVHGTVLGHLGRPPAGTYVLTRTDRLLALGLVLLAFPLALLLAQWLAMAAVLLLAGSIWGWPTVLGSSALAAAALIWASTVGWRTLETALHRWPDHRLGGWLVLGSFAVLLVVFLALEPTLPGTELRLNRGGWVVLAGLATLWVAAPAIILALRLTHLGEDRRVGTAAVDGPPAG
jgi:hypothetical protein